MTTIADNDFTGHTHNRQPSLKVIQHNRQSLSIYGSSKSVSANDITPSNNQDVQSTPIENDIKNHLKYNTNNKTSLLHLDQYNKLYYPQYVSTSTPHNQHFFSKPGPLIDISDAHEVAIYHDKAIARPDKNCKMLEMDKLKKFC